MTGYYEVVGPGIRGELQARARVRLWWTLDSLSARPRGRGISSAIRDRLPDGLAAYIDRLDRAAQETL